MDSTFWSKGEGQKICGHILKLPHYAFSFQVDTLYLNNQKILILSIVPVLIEFVCNSNGSKLTYLDCGQNEMKDVEDSVCKNLNINQPEFADKIWC